MIFAFYDTETNGLLEGKWEKGAFTPPMDKMHSLTMVLIDTDTKARRQISCADQPAYKLGMQGRGWERMPLVDGLKLLATADVRVAFNGQDFDEGAPFRPGAIQLVYPWWKAKPGSILKDPLLLSRLIYSDIHKSGPNNHRLMPFEKRLHNLRTWGKRLGFHKGDYSGGWANWSEDMQEYGEQDTLVLEKIYLFLMAQQPAPTSNAIEHDFAAIVRRQETRGFGFDYDKAMTLQGELVELKVGMEAELIEAFGEWWAYGKAAHSQAKDAQEHYRAEEDEDAEDEEEQARRKAEWMKREDWGATIQVGKTRQVKMIDFPDITIRRFSEKTGKEIKPYVGPPKIDYAAGAEYTPIKRVQFNPKSRAHIRKRLIEKYGWEPSRFTKGGAHSAPVPIVDDDTMRGLPYPEAQMLANYYLIVKRLGQLAEGPQAWMKAARETTMANGQRRFRVHGRVNTCGALGGRCTHMKPNMAQVPKNTAAFKLCPEIDAVQGYRCRELFIAHDPYELVGFDGSSLELRMAAHYLSRWDKGAYAEIVSNSDPHAWMRSEVIGEDIIGSGDPGRDNSKTVFYAIIFGGGDEKIGAIALPTASVAEKRALGKEIKQKIFGDWHAFGQLRREIESVVEDRGFLLGLDGRKLRVRKAHAALNLLLQSAGAIVMKQALIILDRDLQRKAGLQPGRDYEFVANVHDEAQAEVLPEKSPLYREFALEALPQAGRALQVQCPLKAGVSPHEGHGRSWRETH